MLAIKRSRSRRREMRAYNSWRCFFCVVVVVCVRSFIILEIFANANMQRKYINQPDARSRAKMTESKLFQWPGTCEWALRNLIPFSTAIEAFMSERARALCNITVPFYMFLYECVRAKVSTHPRRALQRRACMLCAGTKTPRTACGFAWHGRRVTVPHKSIPIELARRCVGALGRNTNHQLYTSAGWVRTNAYI